MDARSGTDTVSAEELKKVHDLGSKLFFQGGIGLGYPESTGDDYPAVIVRRLEESAEGCRWMLARWAELRNVLDRKAAWRNPEIRHGSNPGFFPSARQLVRQDGWQRPFSESVCRPTYQPEA
jgi:hypothetical protein